MQEDMYREVVMITKMQKVNLSDRIIESIVEMIESGQWELGMKLPNEIDLAASFSVSRNIMREAMKILENFGVLESKPGMGTHISETALDSIHNMNFFYNLKNNMNIEMLLETRLIIEPQLVYLAAKRCTDEQLEELQEKLENVISTTTDKDASYSDDFDFHLAMAEYSQNPICKDMVQTLLNQLRTSDYAEYNDYSNDKMREISKVQHEDILMAITERDADRARDLMTEHLKHRIRTIRSAIQLKERGK